MRRACLLFFAASIRSSSLLMVKKAKFRPESIADWDMHRAERFR